MTQATTENKRGLYLLLGSSLVVQATTSLVGGIVGIGPFTDTGDIPAAMGSIESDISGVYAGMFLQVVTALVIVVLAAALYRAGSHAGKTVAIIAFGLYLMEATAHFIGQILVFAIAEASLLFAGSGDAALPAAAKLLFAARDFTGAIAMMPFGVGALLFYFLITKAGVIPKWLGVWGMATVSLVLAGWSLDAFTAAQVPFALYVPYVPWEWVAGVYIIVKGFKTQRVSADAPLSQNPGTGTRPAPR